MTFEAAFPYQESLFTLPVSDLDRASEWYRSHFGMTEVERRDDPPTVVLERDGVQLGFAVTGQDPGQDGAAIRVADIEAAAADLASRGVEIGDRRVDERDGKAFDVFFVVAPDGLCYYFHAPAPA